MCLRFVLPNNNFCNLSLVVTLLDIMAWKEAEAIRVDSIDLSGNPLGAIRAFVILEAFKSQYVRIVDITNTHAPESQGWFLRELARDMEVQFNRLLITDPMSWFPGYDWDSYDARGNDFIKILVSSTNLYIRENFSFLPPVIVELIDSYHHLGVTCIVDGTTLKPTDISHLLRPYSDGILRGRELISALRSACNSNDMDDAEIPEPTPSRSGGILRGVLDNLTKRAGELLQCVFGSSSNGSEIDSPPPELASADGSSSTGEESSSSSSSYNPQDDSASSVSFAGEEGLKPDGFIISKL
jgi:hypothetical protein